MVRAAQILVIEDNRSDVFLLERALKRQGLCFELTHLVNGDDAIAFIRRTGDYVGSVTPDLILTDLNLAKYTGEEILGEIRGARHLDGVPVCVWSSCQSAQAEALLEALGVSCFITKPTGLDQFLQIGETIAGLLAARGTGARR